MLVVKAHAAEDYELARFGALADAHRSARMAFHRQQALFSPAITLVYAATVSLTLFAYVLSSSETSFLQLWVFS
jgi:hypothetical protein